LLTLLLSAAFFASGASALIFETLWFRQAGLAFGNSIWASSLVLSGFMGGLALGNALAWALGRRRAWREGGRLRGAVLTYALAEAIIALTGVGLVYLLPVLGTVLAPMFRPLLDHSLTLNSLRLLVAFALLVIPSTAMGITLPLLTRALMRDEAAFGRVLGALYGWNTLGAMVGVVAGEMFLVGRFGVRGTALAAGGLNLSAAAVAGVLAFRESEYGDGATQGVESSRHRGLTPARWQTLVPCQFDSQTCINPSFIRAAFHPASHFSSQLLAASAQFVKSALRTALWLTRRTGTRCNTLERGAR
jgi:spermidine synthase